MSEPEFLQAIRANPADETARLIYADWLEEQGDPRAELVRQSRGVPACKAIISDIHGNLEALQAVLAEIFLLNIQDIYCLGDIVGYGPNPVECIDLVNAHSRVTLLGNHDQAAMFLPEGFGPMAEKANLWTRAQLAAAGENQDAQGARWEFLANLPRSHSEGDFLYVHGSPRNPLNEYVFPEDIHNERKMTRLFDVTPRWCYNGHTHIPGIITEDLRYFDPPTDGAIFHLDERKALVNVGSVGQPRDGDWRASYILLVGRTVHFRRVEYDIDTTIRKIYAIPELETFLGDRLRDGR